MSTVMITRDDTMKQTVFIPENCYCYYYYY